MNSIFLTRLLRFLMLLGLQVLILNNIHIMGYATPLLIGYMVLRFHMETSRTSALLWGFAIGLCFDMFSDTAGMASAACTLIAMIQPPLLNMFAPRDAGEDFVPSLRSLGFWSYLSYSISIMFMLHLAFYLLDAFCLTDWKLTAIAVLGGTVLSTLLCVIVELIIQPRKQ